ncbi:membrane-anchored mycosin MYCP [Saccharopolyspora kobensis]|uniref:Membrane-anchored mycosin MYCP n=1 Tax=Saccharopolyspora kobensis TaxID=146035 RepID=A0A1H6EE03_9PSEU|nr:type VII secretion-associated serine protease mycosin [Saccharopolyspora kobensis]SEG95483.1 membrane-anchored mycosin MYCP [Saccharopolyspora kobensis]SFD55900.1 membrane-anchored mycosin MYCP [Saccharopolyspora kobensis]
MRSRFSRGTLRTSALLAAVGVFAFSGPTAPAAAQSLIPPPLDTSKRTGTKLETFGYPQKQACMQGNPGGGMIEEKPWSQRVLGYERAHEQGFKGQNMSVAVIDTGVNNHPRLQGRLIAGDTSIPKGGPLTDCDGHGTIVAGIIAAAPDPTNQTAYVGVAPEASILSLRQSSSLFIEDETNKTIGNTETMAQAINRAAADGVDVINISQSSCQPIAQAADPRNTGNQQLQTAVKEAYDAGIVIVVAAGNVGGTCQKNPTGSPTTAVLPAWFDDYVLTVASVNEQGAPSEFTVPGPWVDVAAPGENLITLDPGQSGTGLASQIAHGQDGQMGPIEGTSFAAPYVAGLAVLIKQKFAAEGKNLTAQQIMDRIKETALPAGGSGGRNDIVGYGTVDAAAALGEVVPSEWDRKDPPQKQARLGADVIPQKDYPALIIAIGGAGAGIAAIVFTAFLTNAVRNVRARTRGNR